MFIGTRLALGRVFRFSKLSDWETAVAGEWVLWLEAMRAVVNL